MSDLDKARQLFQSSGLPFPEIPKELAVRLKERGNWLFSTREIEISPYDLHHYVEECWADSVEDYAILCHSGHGVNSYAIQYYSGPRRLADVPASRLGRGVYGCPEDCGRYWLVFWAG